jgi:phenylpyruvate tautomerase PptA (4-oxalocrotonate tautomerase family)
MRNDIIFADGTEDVMVVIDEIKVQSWKWAMKRMNLAPCSFI